MAPHQQFQIIVLSKEPSHHPLIPALISLGERVERKGYGKDGGTGDISLRYGKRMVITGDDCNMSSLTPDDFIEVVDIDPFTRTLIMMGCSSPSPHVSLHWLLYHLPEVHAIISLSDMIPGKPVVTSPVVDPGFGVPLEVLKTLKKDKCINIHGTGSVMVGETLEEVENYLC